MSKLTDEKLNKLGRPEVERRLGTISWNKANQRFARDWLSRLDRIEDMSALNRAETRELEDLSISKRALAAAERANEIADSARRDARRANIWAIIAIGIAMIAAAPEINFIVSSVISFLRR